MGQPGIAELDHYMNPRSCIGLQKPRTLKAMQMFKALQSGGKQDIDADDIPSSKKVTSQSLLVAQGRTKVIAQRQCVAWT